MTPERILAAARARGARIATAESCTGGLVAAALTDLPGSSDMFDRGFVTYSNAAKIELLGVTDTTLAAHGAVSEATAREMAEGALGRSAASLAVAITGIAGPGGQEAPAEGRVCLHADAYATAKPEGMVCFALAERGRPTRALTVQFGALGRAHVRAAARDQALDLLAKALGA
ncbi:CinA family protein [Paracoccus sp. p4-l81]|uniref:CinA family protein n=1 Tax=unclassified Paracoccus (in: a-proteobacteria) TaxID=2688777 RepID=UPI0035BA1727